ncbi:hypothetical protein DKX38_018016 [Salix brachista]|uniref:Uncharacterized protein n=1 Tax=Salix brachista TaxID=2182728 RepID=A0A5N5KX02_9ROSI|nr:hypothetical protein DKX38_018016 [Salix brachista]
MTSGLGAEWAVEDQSRKKKERVGSYCGGAWSGPRVHLRSQQAFIIVKGMLLHLPSIRYGGSFFINETLNPIVDLSMQQGFVEESCVLVTQLEPLNPGSLLAECFFLSAQIGKGFSFSFRADFRTCSLAVRRNMGLPLMCLRHIPPPHHQIHKVCPFRPLIDEFEILVITYHLGTIVDVNDHCSVVRNMSCLEGDLRERPNGNELRISKPPVQFLLDAALCSLPIVPCHAKLPPTLSRGCKIALKSLRGDGDTCIHTVALGGSYLAFQRNFCDLVGAIGFGQNVGDVAHFRGLLLWSAGGCCLRMNGHRACKLDNELASIHIPQLHEWVPLLWGCPVQNYGCKDGWRQPRRISSQNPAREGEPSQAYPNWDGGYLIFVKLDSGVPLLEDQALPPKIQGSRSKTACSWSTALKRKSKKSLDVDMTYSNPWSFHTLVGMDLTAWKGSLAPGKKPTRHLVQGLIFFKKLLWKLESTSLRLLWQPVKRVSHASISNFHLVCPGSRGFFRARCHFRKG